MINIQKVYHLKILYLILYMKYNNLQEAFTELLKGDRGIKGEQGVIGSSGDIGLRGIDGPIGSQGNEGSKGPPGRQGFIGDRGEQGQQGLTGERGDVGPIGPKGPKGDKGPKGFKGERGERGKPGDKGEKGPQGVTGPTGQSGRQFSNININRDGSCYYTQIKDYNLDFLGDGSKSSNYCKQFYGMAGLKTKGWRNRVKEYNYQCKCYFLSGCKCKNFTVKYWGYQYNRSFEMKCCPAVGPNMDYSNNHNFDEYNSIDSVRLYPFYMP